MGIGRHQSEPTVGEVLAALSSALDLVEGQPQGHAVRTARIALRVAEEMGLSAADREDLFYASLLKDSGCSNNSARLHKFFGGDETIAKREVKVVDWTNPLASAVYGLRQVERGAGLRAKLLKIAEIARQPGSIMDEVTEARCTRGAEIARFLGFGERVASAVHALDEHWDGRGSPYKVAGEDIPQLARILCLAQTLEVFVTTYGVGAGCRMVRARSGRWFAPDVAEAALATAHDVEFWADHAAHLAGEPVPLPVPETVLNRPATGLDRVCEAFAQVIDAKSTFTGEHSTRVTAYADALAKWFDLDTATRSDLHRASLLHDIGKLGVPNTILDKPAKLTEDEFARMREHPRFTFEILRVIGGFGKVAAIASAHHERLDGRGYWQGLEAKDLTLPMRILTAADVFDALSADRPYRQALPVQEVLAIMERDVGTAFDPDCVAGLRALYAGYDRLAA